MAWSTSSPDLTRPEWRTWSRPHQALSVLTMTQPHGQQPYGQQQPHLYGQQPQPYGQQPFAQQPFAQPYGYPYPPAPRTNGLAIASMVLGILWIYWIGSILALVFGYVAKRQIRERGEAGGGMATAGIVLGWVGVGILVLAFVVGFAGSSSFS